jgi:hypothetical protein
MLKVHYLVVSLSYMISQSSFKLASKLFDDLLETLNSINDQNYQEGNNNYNNKNNNNIIIICEQ